MNLYFHIILFSAIKFFCAPMLNAQLESPFELGAQAIGQGNAFAAYDGHYALLHNQAGIANVKEMSFSVDAGQIYNGSGVSHLHAAALLPTSKLGNFGIVFQRYGIDSYNFQNYGLSYGRKLSAKLNIAASFNLYQFRIENYGNALVPNFQIGLQSKMNDRLSIGAHLANPLPLEIVEGVDFPTVLSIGLKYNVSSIIEIYLDVEKNIIQKENIKIGLSYAIHPKFNLRIGMNSFPGSFHFGFALNLQKMQINFGNGFHPILGNTSGLGVLYNVSK